MPGRYNRLMHFLAFGSGVVAMLCVIFFTLFRIFEKITYDQIADLNRDFIIQIDSLTETINSSIINYGMQLFYSDSVKQLMGSAEFSNTERVYCIRNLNTSLSTTDYTESILVYNGYTGHIYSTDVYYPDQTMENFSRIPIRNLVLGRTNGQRFKPIYCQDNPPDGKEYYAFLFYEVYQDGTPKPSTLIITIRSDWYKKALLAANPSSDLIVIDEAGAVLVSASDELRTEYLEYYPLITTEKNSGYFLNQRKKEICMYYESPATGHTYMRISSLERMMPRLLYFRRSMVYFLLTILTVFALVLSVLLVFALFPMLRMKDAIKKIDKLQTGADHNGGAAALAPIPLKDQIDAVVSRSERASMEQIFYDMLSFRQRPERCRLFGEQQDCEAQKRYGDQNAYGEKENTEQFGLMMVHAAHRREIYDITEKMHPELIVTKYSHICVCIGMFESEKDYVQMWKEVAETLGCRCLIGTLFEDFGRLTEHFSNLNELRKLELLLPEDVLVVQEQELFDRTSVNTITTKDFTDLLVRLKSGNLDGVRAKWREILETIIHYRYDDFQYMVYRTEDTICKVLADFSSDLLKDGKKLLPESLEQIRHIGEIEEAFDRAFVVICDNYSERKAEKYSELAEQIKQMVQQDYHDSSLNSQSIADRISMNNAYLGRLFKSSYGRSINDYINTCRIEESMRLLKETELPVEEIAQKVGFGNIKYFYVLFKKSVGVTPAKYRGGEYSGSIS